MSREGGAWEVMRRGVQTILLVSAMTATASGCSTPRLTEPDSASSYYPNASVRLGEAGVVVLHFAIDANGKVTGPIDHDEPVIVAPVKSQDERGALRLIEGAEKYIRHARFDARGMHKRRLTASFVFEVKPCGTLAHSGEHDYAISLCRERPEIPMMPSPHCRLIDNQLRC